MLSISTHYHFHLNTKLLFTIFSEQVENFCPLPQIPATTILIQSKSSQRQLSLIPAVILTIMTICSLKWHFFFYVDVEGIFQRGAFYGVIIPFVYIYIFLVTLRIFTMFPQKKYYALRGKLEMIFGMVVFPVIAGVLQMFFTEISIICFGLTLGIIQVFTAFLTNRITMDELTQINNRTKLMQYLEGYMERHTEGEETDLHFLMIDLDDFKWINDTYGHVEGDRALIRIAGVLKKHWQDMQVFLQDMAEMNSVLPERCFGKRRSI